MTPEELREIVAPACSFKESGFAHDGLSWSAESLYEQAKKEGVVAVDYPLEFFPFDVDGMFKQAERMTDMAYHLRRVIEADTTIPIILGPLGGVMDGFHRILKAVVFCEPLKCYRLKELPEPEEV